jgi:hypothetical protein
MRMLGCDIFSLQDMVLTLLYSFCDGLRTKQFILLVIRTYISHMMDEDWLGSTVPHLVGIVAEPDKDLKKFKKKCNILLFLMFSYVGTVPI